MNGNNSSAQTSVCGDSAKHSWAHAVNSKEQLSNAIKSDCTFIESDILMGTDLVPIMCHPPARQSDLTFVEWLDICKNSGKGVKLDFKTQDVIEPCLIELSKIQNELQTPIILNADILDGHMAADKACIDPDVFLDMCAKYCPNGIISIGWTTKDGNQSSHYSWNNIYEVFDLIKKKRLKQKITFACRLMWALNSMNRLEWLQNHIRDSTLTLWGHSMDNLSSLDSILLFRRFFSHSTVFYDLPDDHARFLHKHLDDSACAVRLSQSNDQLVASYINQNLHFESYAWNAIGETYMSNLSLLLNEYGSQITTKSAYCIDNQSDLLFYGKFVFLSKTKSPSQNNSSNSLRISLFTKDNNNEMDSNLLSLIIDVNGTVKFAGCSLDENSLVQKPCDIFAFSIKAHNRNKTISFDVFLYDKDVLRQTTEFCKRITGHVHFFLSVYLDSRQYAVAFDQLRVSNRNQ